MNLLPVFINYAQKGAKREVECSREHCNQLGLSLFELDLSSAGNSFRDAQVFDPSPLSVHLLLFLSFIHKQATRRERRKEEEESKL